jgi:phosphatidylethanolamine-binding protein (PEBP) family uncharacterized protein
MKAGIRLLTFCLALLLAGCGGSQSGSSSATGSKSSSTGTATSTEASTTEEHLPTVNIPFNSPLFTDTTRVLTMPAHYTCDGANVSPPLSWGTIPTGTKEIDLFIVSIGRHAGKFTVVWGVAGLTPDTRGLAAGIVPATAVVGRSSSGRNRYSLCPSKAGEKYLALLVPVTQRVPVKPGFDVAKVLAQAQQVADFEGQLNFAVGRPNAKH